MAKWLLIALLSTTGEIAHEWEVSRLDCLESLRTISHNDNSLLQFACVPAEYTPIDPGPEPLEPIYQGSTYPLSRKTSLWPPYSWYAGCYLKE